MSNLESPTRRKWRELLFRQRGSGLSVAAFCRRHGVPASSFFAWKRRLPEAGAAPAFVEAKIFDGPRGGGQVRGGGSAGDGSAGDGSAGDGSAGDGSAGGDMGRVGDGVRAGKIEIRLRGGRRLLVGRGFDRQLLVEMVAVLEGLS